jgi:TonB family protein
MHYLTIPTFLLLTAVSLVSAQEQAKTDPKYDSKRCTPKIVSRGPRSKPSAIHARKGEKPTGRRPLIAFEVSESGEVFNARIKQSSGIADIDAHALTWVQSFRYNKRPGCGVLESEASMVHFGLTEKPAE